MELSQNNSDDYVVYSFLLPVRKEMEMNTFPIVLWIVRKGFIFKQFIVSTLSSFQDK